MSVDVAAEVARYRKSAAALRRLTGSNASRWKAQRRHESVMDHAYAALRDAGLHDLNGLLAEEQSLADRLKGVDRRDRPELRVRLRAVQAKIAETTPKVEPPEIGDPHVPHP